MTRRVTLRGQAEMLSHEALVTARYLDKIAEPPIWTIGVGITRHAGASINPDTFRGTLSIHECLRLFQEVLPKYEAEVDKLIVGDLRPYEFDALVSCHFNTGMAYGKNRTSRRYIREGRYEAAIRLWWRNPQLRERRTKEANLCATGRYGNGICSVYPASSRGNVQWSKGRRVDAHALLEEMYPYRPLYSYEEMKG